MLCLSCPNCIFKWLLGPALFLYKCRTLGFPVQLLAVFNVCTHSIWLSPWLERLKKRKKKREVLHGWQSYLREHPKGQEVTLGVPTLPDCNLDVPCNNLNFHTGEAAQANGRQPQCLWEGFTTVCFSPFLSPALSGAGECGRYAAGLSRWVTVGTAAVVLGHREISGQPCTVSSLLFLFSGLPWMESRVVHKLRCLNFCPALSRVFSAWQVIIQATAKLCLLFFIVGFSIYFFSSGCCWWEGWEQP